MDHCRCSRALAALDLFAQESPKADRGQTGDQRAGAEPRSGTRPAAATQAPPAAKIYFDVGKADLPTGAGDTLKAAVDFLKANPAAKAVIAGYHDPTGNKAQNEELAKNRAITVRGVLAGAGIGDDRIVMVRPVATTGGGSDAEARRVEVEVRP